MKTPRGDKRTLLDPGRPGRVEALRRAEIERRALENREQRRRQTQAHVSAREARYARRRNGRGRAHNRGLPYIQRVKPVPPGHRVPVLRVYPPAAFRTVSEASVSVGLSTSAISRAVRCGQLAGGRVWTVCPPHLLRALRPELFADRDKAATPAAA